jgi:predicted DCC family thiol-disulfide oxidoreductase YuxK
VNIIKNKSIILFDGVCNLCNTSVQFIIKNDPKKQFLFTSLQSDVAKEILLHHTSKKINLSTIILIKNGHIYDKSTAVLLISKELNNFYSLCYFFMIIPKFIRDGIYMVISKNRYKWFGKKEKCMLPSKDNRDRFL